MLPYLSKEQVIPGIKVRTYQLANLFDSYILLSDFHMALDDNGLPSEIAGTVEFIGDQIGKDNWMMRHPEKEVMVVAPTPYEGCDINEYRCS